MYWNNTWVHTFNSKNFFNKTLFLENIFMFLFTDRVFFFFFKNKFFKKYTKKHFFVSKFFKKLPNINNKRNSLRRKNKSLRRKLTKKYNFTRLWVIKFNKFILFTTFVFFYFKVKKKKKLKNRKKKITKTFLLFWKRKKSYDFKKNIFKKKVCFNF